MMYGQFGLPSIVDQSWFSIRMMKTVLMPSRPLAPAQFNPPAHKQAAAREKQVLADMALCESGHTPLIPAQMQAFSTPGPELTPGRLGWRNDRNDRQYCVDSSVSRPIRFWKRIKHRRSNPRRQPFDSCATTPDPSRSAGLAAGEDARGPERGRPRPQPLRKRDEAPEINGGASTIFLPLSENKRE